MKDFFHVENKQQHKNSQNANHDKMRQRHSLTSHKIPSGCAEIATGGATVGKKRKKKRLL